MVPSFRDSWQYVGAADRNSSLRSYFKLFWQTSFSMHRPAPWASYFNGFLLTISVSLKRWKVGAKQEFWVRGCLSEAFSANVGYRIYRLWSCDRSSNWKFDKPFWDAKERKWQVDPSTAGLVGLVSDSERCSLPLSSCNYNNEEYKHGLWSGLKS